MWRGPQRRAVRELWRVAWGGEWWERKRQSAWKASKDLSDHERPGTLCSGVWVYPYAEGGLGVGRKLPAQIGTVDSHYS